MKTNEKKKFRIGRVFSIITSAIMLSLSLQPLDDGGAFARIIYLVPLSIAAWLFFLGRENVFDYRETGETYEEDYDIVTEDLFGGKHTETYTVTHNKSEGGFLEHSMKASWVFIPLCALDAFLCKGPGRIGFYWLIPAILIVLNIWFIIEDLKPPKDSKKTTESATKEVDDKPTIFKDVGDVKVEGARAQYYFDQVQKPGCFVHDIYKIEGNTATNKLYRVSGLMRGGMSFFLSLYDNHGDSVGYVDYTYDILTHEPYETHKISVSEKLKYKIICDVLTVPCDNCAITDPDGNKLAYYKIISPDLKSRHGIYGPNGEPYATWDNEKILSIMKDCPIDDSSVMLMIAAILRNNLLKIVGL